MSDLLSKAFDIIEEIRHRRWSLLPPYTYNEDEDERSAKDYLEYYYDNIDACLVSVKQYIDSLQEFATNTRSDEFFHNLLQSRQRYIQFLPFCYDELNFIQPSDFMAYNSFMKNIYKHDLTNDYLIRNIIVYKELLEKLVNYMNNKDSAS